MNTDHINYQQEIAQSINEEKDQELLEKIVDAPKQQISASSSSSSIGRNQILINDDNQGNNMNILTPIQRRERIFTLLIIAIIALLTGKLFLLKIKTNFFFRRD
jgi:hypothetical protein